MIHILRHSLAFSLYSFPLFRAFFFFPRKRKSYWRKSGQAQKCCVPKAKLNKAKKLQQEMNPAVTRKLSKAAAHNRQEGGRSFSFHLFAQLSNLLPLIWALTSFLSIILTRSPQADVLPYSSLNCKFYFNTTGLSRQNPQPLSFLLLTLVYLRDHGTSIS